MKLKKLFVPITLVFNALAVSGAYAEEPKDYNTLSQQEQVEFLECQMEGPTLENKAIIEKEINEHLGLQRESQKYESSPVNELEQTLRSMENDLMEIYALLLINYYACGLDMNVDLNTLPQSQQSSVPSAAPQP